MKMQRLLNASIAASAAFALAAAWAAAEEDVFAFIPQGGRTVLAQALNGKAATGDVQAMLTARHTREEWIAWIKAHAALLPSLQKLPDKEMQTVADYLAFNMPLPAGKAPASPTRANWEKALPWDGRDMALEKCQGCHIITVVITQNRTKEAWLGTMGKPSHIMIKLSKEQREQLANFLVLNAGIPIEEVPPELRAGGASY